MPIRKTKSWPCLATLAVCISYFGCNVETSTPPPVSELGVSNEEESSHPDAAKANGMTGLEYKLSPDSEITFKKFRAAEKQQNWGQASNFLGEICVKEPANITFWVWRAGFLNFDVSKRFESPEEQYKWRRAAILVLLDGWQQNPNELRFPYETGFLIGSLATAARKKQFQHLFADDHDLHLRFEERVKLADAHGPDNRPHFALTAKLFALTAIQFADRTGKLPPHLGPLLFYVAPVEYQSRYAEALLEDGEFGRAAAAWKETQSLLDELAQREIQLHDDSLGRMAELPQWRAKKRELWKQFDEACPGLRLRLFEQALKKFPEELQRAMREEAEKEPWAPDLRDVERELGTQDLFALSLAREAIACGQRVENIQLNRFVIKFDELLLRCQIEQTSESLHARNLLFRARSARESGHLDSDSQENPGAMQLYRQAFRLCASNLRGHPDWSENYLYWDDIVYESRTARRIFGDDIVPQEIVDLSLKWAP
jgi:hypothetical protein